MSEECAGANDVRDQRLRLADADLRAFGYDPDRFAEFLDLSPGERLHRMQSWATLFFYRRHPVATR